jgi:ubiquinone/menaquinone biosynthesis C-methylase UbiE
MTVSFDSSRGVSLKRDELLRHARLVAEYHRRHAPAAGRVYHAWWNALLLQHLPPSPRARVLDLNCGTGVLLQDLTKRYRHPVGIDLSPHMLAAAAGRRPDLVRGDGEMLPFGSASLDAVVCRGALHHLPDVARGIREVARVLRPGGRVVMAEPNHDALSLRLPRWAWRKWSARFGEEHRALASRWLLEQFSAAGCHLVERRSFGYLAFPLCGMLDILPLLAHLPDGAGCARRLIAIDERLARLPGVRRESWGLLLVLEKA